MNTNEIIVDKENIENKVNDMIKVIQEIKRGGSIQCLQDKIVISGEKDAIEIELPYLDVDAVKEQYPDAKISTVVLNGVTIVTADGTFIDCGIEKKSGISAIEEKMGLELGDIGDVIVKVYDETKGTGMGEMLVAVGGCVSDIHSILKSTEEGTTNVDEVVDTLGGGTGVLGKKLVELYTNMTMRDTLVKVLEGVWVDLEAGWTSYIPMSGGKGEIQVIWAEGEETTGSHTVDYAVGKNDFYNFAYQLLTDNLSEEEIEQLEIENSIDIDKDGVIGAQKAEVKVDPLIIDLNENGVFTTGVDEGTYFDFQDDGFKEKTAWAERGDGILVYDRNKNGQIDDAGELFGDRTLLSDGTYAANGYEALKQYDEDKNNRIDAEDEIFDKLSVWIDENQNGMVDEGELKTLQELQIKSIGVAYQKTNLNDINGNTIQGQTEIIKNDGTTLSMGAFQLQSDTTDTINSETIDVPDYIKYKMPDLTGSGNMLTLHQAMTKNAVLYDLVREYVSADRGVERYLLAEKILIEWSGCGEEKAGSRGSAIDAVHMAVIEKFYGKEFMGQNGKNPNSEAGVILENVYQELLSQIRQNLILNTTAFSYMFEIKLGLYDTPESKNINLLSLMEQLDTDYRGKSTEKYEVLWNILNSQLSTGIALEEFISDETEKKFVEYGFNGMKDFLACNIQYMSAQDIWSGNAGNEIIVGNAKDNTIYGNDGNDHLYGDEGNDVLYGGYGDDILNGGRGNDILVKTNGTDTYEFNAGDGNDILRLGNTYIDRSGDKIVFLENVKKEDILAKREGQNLILENVVTKDTITIEKAYQSSDGRYHVKDILFADGEKLTNEEITEMIRKQGIHGGEGDDVLSGLGQIYGYDQNEILHGHGGNDTIYGNDGNDHLYGDEGNDVLYGGYGDDILNGGEGDDILYGGADDDIYIFEKGDGQDKISDNSGKNSISFGSLITPDSIIVDKEGTNVRIQFQDSEDMITLVDGLKNDIYKNFELNFIDQSAAVIDFTREEENHLYFIKNAEQQESMGTEQEVQSDMLTNMQVLQMVDVMNGESENALSAQNTYENTVVQEEVILFAEES